VTLWSVRVTIVAVEVKPVRAVCIVELGVNVNSNKILGVS